MPYFKVSDGKLQAFRALCEEFVAKTQNEPKCLYYGFSFMDLITNYFISRSSSGWVEGLNNKIKVLKRRAYGVKNLGNLFRRIWLDLKGYEAFAH